MAKMKEKSEEHAKKDTEKAKELTDKHNEEMLKIAH